jgi:hypothetical protein
VANPPPTPAPPFLFGGSDDSRGDTFLILDWGPAAGAASYDLQLIYGSPAQSDIRVSVQAGGQIGALMPNRIYAAAIRAVAGPGVASAWSPSLMTATKPPLTLPPTAVRMPDDIAMTIGWTVDLAGVDRPGVLRVDVGAVYGPASMTPISQPPGPFPAASQAVALVDDATIQFYAIRLVDDGSALPGGVVNASYWSSRSAPLRGQTSGLPLPGPGDDPLSRALSLRRLYGRRW